jgi:hypothetical protein
VWLRRSLAVALAVAFVSGCLWSDPKAYSAPDVVEVLSNHGFSVEGGLVDRSDTDKEFQKVFPGVVPEGVLDIAEAREASNPHVDTLVLAALIFETQDKASCAESNIVGICLRKRNVVVVVREDRAEAAREALEDLG